ncbi:MAG: nucleotide exchange factor GrpE [Candidatus Omnitrophota bacterium]
MDKDKPLQKDTSKKEKKPIEEIDYKDKWLRSLAEYDNLRKRFEREKQDTIKFSNQLLIMELFPIMDSFDSAIKSAGISNDKESFLKGLKMLQAEFHRVLENSGLKKIKSLGEKFNPHLHEAHEEVFSDKFPEGIIVEEIRGGYTLNDGLLRPALVKVSKGKENKTENKNQKLEKGK